MSTVLARALDTFALMAVDSLPGTIYPDGSMEWGTGGSVPFWPLPLAFVGSCGQAAVGRAAASALEGSGPLALDGIMERIDGPVDETVRTSLDVVLARKAKVHVLTVASGQPEVGIRYGCGRLDRLGPGHDSFSPPFGIEREESLEAFDAWRQAPMESGYGLIRSVARLFSGLAERAPSLSGRIHLGILQKPAEAWSAARLTCDARELASATDSDISRRLRPCLH